jgi:hypothetical protein
MSRVSCTVRCAEASRIFQDAPAPMQLLLSDGASRLSITCEGLNEYILEPLRLDYADHRSCVVWNPQEKAGTSFWSDMEKGDGVSSLQQARLTLPDPLCLRRARLHSRLERVASRGGVYRESASGGQVKDQAMWG